MIEQEFPILRLGVIANALQIEELSDEELDRYRFLVEKKAQKGKLIKRHQEELDSLSPLGVLADYLAFPLFYLKQVVNKDTLYNTNADLRLYDFGAKNNLADMVYKDGYLMELAKDYEAEYEGLSGIIHEGTKHRGIRFLETREMQEQFRDAFLEGRMSLDQFAPVAGQNPVYGVFAIFPAKTEWALNRILKVYPFAIDSLFDAYLEDEENGGFESQWKWFREMYKLIGEDFRLDERKYSPKGYKL